MGTTIRNRSPKIAYNEREAVNAIVPEAGKMKEENPSQAVILSEQQAVESPSNMGELDAPTGKRIVEAGIEYSRQKQKRAQSHKKLAESQIIHQSWRGQRRPWNTGAGRCKLLGDITSSPGAAHHQWKFVVYPSADPHAFVSHNRPGYIFISTGMLS